VRPLLASCGNPHGDAGLDVKTDEDESPASAAFTGHARNSGQTCPLLVMSVRNRTVTALLVEDEVLVRVFMADVLEDAGFRVIEAANAWVALNWLEAGEDVQVLFN
jgi:hypothetical protein